MKQSEAPRTANDVYRDFGKAVDRLVNELVDMRVPPGGVETLLPGIAGVPIGFGPLLSVMVRTRTFDAEAAAQRKRWARVKAKKKK